MSGSLRIHSWAAFLFLFLFATVFRKTAEKMCLSFCLTCGNLWNTVILLRPNRLPANCTYEIYCTHRHHQSLLPPGNWEFQTITVKKEIKVVVKTEQETAQYILIKYLDASFSHYIPHTDQLCLLLKKQMLLCPLSAQYWKLTCVQDEIRNFIYCSGRLSRDGSWCQTGQSVRVLIITLWWLPLRSWLYQVWDCVRTSRTWRRAEMISAQKQWHLSPWSGLDLFGDQLKRSTRVFVIKLFITNIQRFVYPKLKGY